jgi:Fur family ferric uptake transcriptional regulator
MSELSEEIRQKILAYMESNGLRLTAQRRAIITAAFTTTEHYTAEELLDRARSINRSVSRATVYRTLPVLVKTGLLRELDLGRDYKYYDPNYANHPNHNHIVCLECSKIIEFEDYCLDVRESVVAKGLGFSPSIVRLRIEAHCDDFQKKGSCPRRAVEAAAV